MTDESPAPDTGSDDAVERATDEPDGPAITEPIEEWEEQCPGPALRVRYLGSGSATSGTFTAEMSDGTSQGDTSLPIRNQSGSLGLIWCAPRGTFVYLSIQNAGRSGSVVCEIEIDGAYVIASCNGSA